MPDRCDLVNSRAAPSALCPGPRDPDHIIVVSQDGRKRKAWSDVVEGMAHLNGGAWGWVAQLIESGWVASRDGDALVLVWGTPQAQFHIA